MTDEDKTYINHLNTASGNKKKNAATGYTLSAYVTYWYYYEIRENKTHNCSTFIRVHRHFEVQTFEQFYN
jgi:hypothetical protein